MDIQSEKLLVIDQLLRIEDIKIIEQVRTLLQKESNPIVGFDANGLSISRTEFIQKLKQAESEYESGNYQAIEEIERE